MKKQEKHALRKKYKGFEKPVDKIKRWKRNIRFIIQRVKYGYGNQKIYIVDTETRKYIEAL